MFELNSLGRWLIVAGLGIAALGGLILALGKVPFFGRLPGDLRFESADGRFSCFAPIASMILLSVILTIVLNVVLRLINRQ